MPGIAGGVCTRLMSAALLAGSAAAQSDTERCSGFDTESRAVVNKCDETDWKNTLRLTPPPAGGMPAPVGGCTAFSCTWWPHGEPNPLESGSSFNVEASYGITAPGFEIGWDGGGWNGMEGWVFDQRVYAEYLLLSAWLLRQGTLDAGDFTDDTRFSKPLMGASCPWEDDGTTAAGCATGATTSNGGRARSCSSAKCAVLALGAPTTAMCHTPRCEAKESVSQNISIPWNAKELKFRHRRENAGGSEAQGSWARLVINRPGTKVAVPPSCQQCPGTSGTLSQGPCDYRPCNDLLASCAGDPDTCPGWTYTPPVCPFGSTCPKTSTGSDVLWEIQCNLAGHGAMNSDTENSHCAMPCEDTNACTTEELLENFLEETIDLAPYVYDVDAATRVPGTSPAEYDYTSRRQKLIDHGDTTWTISFQASTIDLWAVYVDDLTMTFKRPGCTDRLACNYDEDAEIDDGTCVAKSPGCTDPRSANYDEFANIDPGDMCITFGQGEAPTLREIQLGSTKDAPSLMIDDNKDAPTYVNVENGEPDDIELSLQSNVKYPYWSHKVHVSPDGWDALDQPAGAPVEDSPVGFQIRSEFADDLTLLVYEEFSPKEPRSGLLHTARLNCDEKWQVKCENASFVNLASNMCPNNGLVRTILTAGKVYTVVVIPDDADDYQADATGQTALVQGQGEFDLQIFASRGAIKEIPPVCGNGVVEGSLEQCDPKSGAEAEWCTPPRCSGTATDMSTYTTGPTDFPHWYTPAYHCVAAFESAVQAGSPGSREDCPAGCDWSGQNGCQGIAASFSFDQESISLSEGEKARVKIKRRAPPDWLPHTSSRVRVKVHTADGEGPNAAHAEGTDGADDYDEIKADFLVFEECTDESLSCMEQFLEIETFADTIFEYPTEHFYVLLDLQCDVDDGCSRTAKLEYPSQLRVDIVNNPWAPSEIIVATIIMLCTTMLGITAWLTSWINGAHEKRKDKLRSELADNFAEDGMYGDVSPAGSVSPSFRSNSVRGSVSPSFRSNSIRGSGSPSFRSNSIAPGNASPSFNQRRTSVLAGGSSRRASVAPGQNSSRRASVAVGQNGARRASVAPGAERRSSIAPGAGGTGRRQRAPSISGTAGGMDEDALAALHQNVEGMGKRRTQSNARRKGSVSMGQGDLGLANRVRGGDGGKSSGRRRRGSVREIEPEDEQPSSAPKASSSGRRRRGSVKEISLEPPKKEITLGRSDSKAKASQSSGRRRRGSVNEVLTPAVTQVSAASAFSAAGKKASSSGRRRRGSVKEIEPADAVSSPAPAPQSSGRRRRGSVNDVIPVSGSPKAQTADLTSASVTTSRRRGTTATGVGDAGVGISGSDSRGSGRRASVAAGGSRRASNRPGAVDDADDASPPGVVSKLSGLASGGSGISNSRKQRAGGGTSPANGRSKAGKSPKALSRASSGSGSDGTASPAVRDADKESSRPKRGGYTNAAMFHAMQAALAQSEHVLDENKGLVGKLKLTGAALLGGLCTAATAVVFLNLTSSELDSCEAASDGQCLAHMVGNGHCEWECNIDECNYDGGDCEFYTDACRFAWYHDLHNSVGGQPDRGKQSCYFQDISFLDSLNDDNAFISPAGRGQIPIENNVVMGCFSLEQVDGTVGPDNPPTLASRRLKDGKCDPACNFEACGWDGGDCEESQLKASPQCSEGCYSHMLGDRHCNAECNTESCFFDLRDCTDSYKEWSGDTAAQAQKDVPVGLPEALICDRETPDPTQTQCGLMNSADVLSEIYSLNFNDQNELKSPTDNNDVDPARSIQDFYDECDADEPEYIYDDCIAEKAIEFQGYTAEVHATWRRLKDANNGCPETAAKILRLHREARVNDLVATLTHAHTCQDRCDTPACGHDAGACYDVYWCAPGCSPDKLLNLVCDQECFTAACGWDAPACNSCEAFVDPDAGLYKDVINAITDASGPRGGFNVLLLAFSLLVAIVLVLRIRTTIIIALDGFFDPMGKSLSKIWNKEDVGPFDPGSVSKSSIDRYTAPVWPVAYAGPLLAEPKNDWTENENDYNEDTGRYGLKYHSSAVEYLSEDSEPMRLELHQAQSAALATALSIIFLISLPAIVLVAGAEPRLAGATQVTEISIGNLFDPESACKYPLGMYELLSTNLKLLWEESDDGSNVDGKPQCGSPSMAVHAFLLADVLAVTCLLLMLRSRYRDLGKLRSEHPRLSDYCVHVAGLGRGTKLASDVDRMIKQLKWLDEKDHAQDVTVLPIWQDDLHWAWARLQKAQLDAVGLGENPRGDELSNLVHKLEGSRANVAYPRPFSGHAICIFNKQYMARAMLHTYKMPVFQMMLKLLLPGEDLGGDEPEEGGKKKSKTKVSVQRGGDPDDIDWLSFRSGGSASFADTWRSRVTRIGASLSLASVLMLSLAIMSKMKQADSEAINEAMSSTDAQKKATETLQALVVQPFGGSLLIILLTEVGAWIVTFTAARAAPYRAHTYSAQRESVLVRSSFAQVCMLVVFPYMLLGDPFSWNATGTVSATSVFAKCKPVVEKAVNQELPGAEFIPAGFVEMTLWLQILNATIPHLLRLMNFSHWPKMILEATGKDHGKAHGWEFDFSLETSESYTVRTVALALCFSAVQPVGLALAAIGLLVGYSTDRLRAGRCKSASLRSMRRGAGIGDVYDQQVVLTLLQSVVALHALLLCCWIESVRLAENPFIVNVFSISTTWVYPVMEFLIALVSLGGKAQGTICWLVVSYFLFSVSYTLFPLAGHEDERPLGIGQQPGGPNITILLTIVLSGVLISPFSRPMSWFLGPLDPIEIATKGKREADEEAYYTASEMPFKPKSVMDDQVEADVASILM